MNYRENKQKQSEGAAKLAEARNRIALEGPAYEDSISYEYCCRAYGRTIPLRTWQRWRRKSLAKVDRSVFPPGTNSFATHVCLMSIAIYLRGNNEDCKARKISQAQLAEIITRVSEEQLEEWENETRILPDILTVDDLDELVSEIIPLPSERTQRRVGFKRRKHSYTKTEAKNILRRLNHHEFQIQKAS